MLLNKTILYSAVSSSLLQGALRTELLPLKKHLRRLYEAKQECEDHTVYIKVSTDAGQGPLDRHPHTTHDALGPCCCVNTHVTVTTTGYLLICCIMCYYIIINIALSEQNIHTHIATLVTFYFIYEVLIFTNCSELF